MTWNQTRGFSLIEVLVALAIITIALGASLRATAVTAGNALALRERTLAGWVAENELSRVQQLAVLPAVGSADGEAVQGGERFIWQTTVDGTPNPNFRRVTVKVRRPNSQYVLAELRGFATENR